MKVNFVLNGQPVSVFASASSRLLDVIRDEFNLTGAKEGCGQGECGACTVIVNEKAVNSCLIPIAQVEGADVLTIEGLEKNGELDEMQNAFLEAGAIQCGYCTPGMIMSLKALFMSNNKPSKQEIVDAVSGNICRCTGYTKIIAAAEIVSEVNKAKGGK